MVLVEIGLPTAWTEAFDVTSNDEELRLNLDILEEKRETSQLELAHEYQRWVKQHYDARVRLRRFHPGDLILRKVLKKGALEPTWEGLYQVKDERRAGTYILIDLKGKQLPHPWNAQYLRIYHR